MCVLSQKPPDSVFSKAATHSSLCLVCDHTTQDKARKVKRGPPMTASPPHLPPYTWVILSTETGIPSMVRGGSSELTSCGAGACSARADSKSSRIMLLYFRTCRELGAEINKMLNSQGRLVPSNKKVVGLVSLSHRRAPRTNTPPSRR